MTQIEQNTANAVANDDPVGVGLPGVRDTDTVIDPRVQQALALYSTGQYGLRAVGRELGVSHEIVRRWMLDELGPEYATLQRQALIARVAESDAMLEDAETMVDIARANAICRYSRWDAERRLPAMFGQQTKVTIDVAPGLADRLRQARSRVSALESTSVIDITDDQGKG